ncbi:hypothetical protein [Metapseudomonas otitidis]|uniref:hypothetical protein n=1 Tax=Metapseudomonas otitidis TaxID=319939 RepID=UPI003CF0278C
MQKRYPIAESFRALQKRLDEVSAIVGELAELFEAKSKESLPDMLTEAQMAEHLGISIRAIRTRRARGQIPAEVYLKAGSRYHYSLSRYEAWIESLWPPSPQPLDSKSKARGMRKAHKKSRQPIYLLT